LLWLAKNDFTYAASNQCKLQRGQILHFHLLTVSRYLLDCAKFFAIEFHGYLPRLLWLAKNDFTYAASN
jgi:hypothetical protein